MWSGVKRCSGRLSQKVSITVASHYKAPASVPGVQGQTIGPSIFRQANRLKDRDPRGDQCGSMIV